MPYASSRMTYAKYIRIVDAERGSAFRYVVEANSDEGWISQHVEDDHGLLVREPSGRLVIERSVNSNFLIEFNEGKFEFDRTRGRAPSSRGVDKEREAVPDHWVPWEPEKYGFEHDQPEAFGAAESE